MAVGRSSAVRRRGDGAVRAEGGTRAVGWVGGRSVGCRGCEKTGATMVAGDGKRETIAACGIGY